MSDQLKDTTRSWLKAFFLLLAGLVAVALLVAAPLSGLWLYLSGELAVDRAVQAQSRGFALFGSTVGRNANATLEYKLDLYSNTSLTFTRPKGRRLCLRARPAWEASRTLCSCAPCSTWRARQTPSRPCEQALMPCWPCTSRTWCSWPWTSGGSRLPGRSPGLLVVLVCLGEEPLCTRPKGTLALQLHHGYPAPSLAHALARGHFPSPVHVHVLPRSKVRDTRPV